MITRQNRAKNNVDDNTLEHFISLQEEVISITKKYKDDKDDGDKILCIQTRSCGGEYNDDKVIKDYEASSVILAVPPRLIVSKITFEPPLPVDTREAMEATPTWMAGASKVLCIEVCTTSCKPSVDEFRYSKVKNSTNYESIIFYILYEMSSSSVF